MAKCLIVERHLRETGGNENQVQVPVDPSALFFSTLNGFDVTVFAPNSSSAGLKKVAGISRYPNRTVRVNQIPEFKGLNSCMVFIQELDVPNSDGNIYEIWWRWDVSGVVSTIGGFERGRGFNQYSPPRRWTIVDRVVPKNIGTK